MGKKVVRLGNIGGYYATTRRAMIEWRTGSGSAYVKGLITSRIAK